MTLGTVTIDYLRQIARAPDVATLDRLAGRLGGVRTDARGTELLARAVAARREQLLGRNPSLEALTTTTTTRSTT